MGGMRARSGLLALFAFMTLTACGSTSPVRQAETSTDRIYVAGSVGMTMGIQVYDASSHALMRRLPLGVPSPDWTALYSVVATPKPQLIATDPATGAVLRTQNLPGAYELPAATLGGLPGGLSQDGAYLVLTSPNNGGSASRFVVADTSFSKLPIEIELSGKYTFDAISNDGIRLYLIQYVTSTDYHVRVYNVLSRYLETSTVVDKREVGPMQGLRISGVFSHDGTWLYSIYARKDKGPFIHALNLNSAYAWCIDFAERSGSGTFGPNELSWSLALNADGSRLYAANGATGDVAVIDVHSEPQAITSTAHLTHVPVASSFVVDAHAKEIGGNDAVVSADGRTLVFAGSLGVTWVDLSSLSARIRQVTDQTVVSLALNASGSTLYAVGASGAIGVVPMTAGTPAAWSWFSTNVQPVALVRVQAL